MHKLLSQMNLERLTPEQQVPYLLKEIEGLTDQVEWLASDKEFCLAVDRQNKVLTDMISKALAKWEACQESDDIIDDLNGAFDELCEAFRPYDAERAPV